MYEGTFPALLCHVNQTCFFPASIIFSSDQYYHPNDPADIARHDRMVALVTQMLDLNRKLQEARPGQREYDAVLAD